MVRMKNNQPNNLLLTGHQPAHNTELSCICLQNTIQTHLPLSLQVGKQEIRRQEACLCHALECGARISKLAPMVFTQPSQPTKKAWPRGRLTWMQCFPNQELYHMWTGQATGQDTASPSDYPAAG